MNGILKPHLHPGETGIDPSVAYKKLECRQCCAEGRVQVTPDGRMQAHKKYASSKNRTP
jgi:hypothetical protein